MALRAQTGPYFGDFGGRFVPESLVAALDELSEAYTLAKLDPEFQRELDELNRGALLAAHPELRPVPISGGSSCWVEGPAWLDAEALALAAESHGVLIEPGSVFFSAATPTRNCLRLGFSAIATERIGEGVERLAAALRELAPRG